MSPFTKGALGFLGCAGIFGAAYVIGKKVGREETLKEVEYEERKAASEPKQQIESEPELKVVSAPAAIIKPEDEPIEMEDCSAVQETVAERVRNRKKGFKNSLFSGASAIKGLFGDADGKKIIITVENGDVVARLSQKGA